MKSEKNISIVGVVGLFVVALLMAGAGRSSAGELSSPEVEELLGKRVGVLEELVAVEKERFQSGNASIDAVLAAEQELLRAKLDMALDAAAKVALREKLLANLAELEQVLSAQMKDGLVQAQDFLRVKAARLKAEADILREVEQ